MNTCQSKPDIEFDDLIYNIQKEYANENQSYPWIVGYSGGKDSTLVAHLVFSAVSNVAPNKRNRDVYIVSNDTLIENPLVHDHITKQLQMMSDVAKAFKLPIYPVVTKPEDKETFWALLVGKGYPTPKLNIRWCTDRLKIKPTSNFIKQNISQYGSAIIVLGVRKDESSTRKRSIERHKNLENSVLTPHSDLHNAFIYRPIVELTTNDVWYFLAHNDPVWGGTHEELIQLYKDAEGGECPMVLSKNEAQNCGVNSGRFGCWVCTLVNKDRSLEGFISSGNDQFAILNDFRNWLVSIRDDPKMRQLRRRDGKITYKNGKHIFGPFTIEARKLILEKLLYTQSEYKKEIITQKEIDIIKKYWSQDMIKSLENKGD